MKIASNNSIINKVNKTATPSFRGQRLFSVKLLNTYTNKFEKCYFTKLDTDDLGLMEQVLPFWKDSQYGQNLINRYIKNTNKILKQKKLNKILNYSNFFVLENKNNKDPRFKIKGLAQVEAAKDYLNISFIQSINQSSINEKIRGAGTIMLYGLVKYAQHTKKDNVYLTSLCDGFYYKAGFQNIFNGFFELPDILYPWFIKNIEKKYNITPKDNKLL